MPERLKSLKPGTPLKELGMDGVVAPLTDTLAKYLQQKKKDPDYKLPLTSKKLEALVEGLADLIDPDRGTDAVDVERDLRCLLKGQIAVLLGEGDTDCLKTNQRESLDDLIKVTQALTKHVMSKVTDALARRASVASGQHEQRSRTGKALAS